MRLATWLVAGALIAPLMGLGAVAHADEPKDDEAKRQQATAPPTDQKGWYSNLDDGRQAAEEYDKPILIYFRRLAERTARQMDDALEEERVSDELNEFVRVKIDMDLQPAEAEKAVKFTGEPIQGIPQFQVLRSDGSFFDAVAGYMPAETFELWLRRAYAGLDPSTRAVQGIYVVEKDQRQPTLDQGLQVAEVTGKPILVYFRRLASEVSRDLDSESFDDEDVKRVLTEFVVVQVDVDLQPEEVRHIEDRYGIEMYAAPALWTLESDGTMIERNTGFMPAPALKAFLERSLRKVRAGEHHHHPSDGLRERPAPAEPEPTERPAEPEEPQRPIEEGTE